MTETYISSYHINSKNDLERKGKINNRIDFKAAKGAGNKIMERKNKCLYSSLKEKVTTR